jgi:nitrate reductase beta subunit
MGDGRSKHVFEVNPSEIKEPVARIARSDKRMLVMCSYARKWCEKNKILYSWFKDELDKRGFLTQQTGSRGKGLRTSIFKGTSLPTTQVQVLEFDYDALLSHHHDTFKYKVIDGSK